MPATPRIFISYARADGEGFAEKLCERLEAEEPELTFWRDRYELEGGKDWWNQVTNSLDQVQFAVLVMTPAATRSRACRAEWRYARSQGVCVYPVKGAPPSDLKIGKLPKWMSRAHFYDLEKEWPNFVGHLKGSCEEERVPFMAPELPVGHVERRAEITRLLDSVRDSEENPIVGTMAVHGAGGFGKTTLAAALCHDDEVLTAFSNGILWVTLGENPDVKGGLTKLYAALTGERPAFVDGEEATTRLRERLADKNCLLVIDDAWNSSHVRPFLQAGKSLSCLVTTRNREIAAEADRRLPIAEMTVDEAVGMLTGRLETKPADLGPFQEMAERLGEWPLLLRLAAATLRQRLQRGDSVEGALAYLEQGLDKRGFTVFDQRDPKERNQAVAKTMEVSLGHLEETEKDRYFELSIFPDDVEIPFSAVGVLWGEGEFETENLLDRLDDLSLLDMDLRTHSARLHDVIRAFIGQRMAESGQAADPTLAVRGALAGEPLRYEQRRPGKVFALARDGKLNAAEQALALIEADPTWRQLALLTAAWLAAPAAAADARALRDRVAAEAAAPEVLALLERLRDLPNSHPPADPNLPGPPDAFMVNSILDRLGGGGATAVEPLDLEGIGDEAPAFLAEQDGPFLVAFAAEDPEHNTAPLARYISMLASNEYEYYRNRSLGILLRPVLEFGDAGWVQDRLVDLCSAALSGQRVDFREPIAIAADAQLARAGHADAASRIEKLRENTMNESANLSPDRGQGDPWGHYLRRLAILAEAYSQLLDDGGKAASLLDRALALPFGFAGFRTQACLMLAESIRVSQPDNRQGIEAALKGALRAAHNVQDPTFCALSTARVRCMQQRWWNAPFDMEATSSRLAATPQAPEFCPTHCVDEDYSHRDPSPTKLPSPIDTYAMDTLSGLAALFRCPEEELLRLNADAGWGVTDVLPQDALVNIPDPDFAPLLAARLAAEALISLPESKQIETLETLLQIAQPDTTALNTVAARLLFAEGAGAPEAIERLVEATRVHAGWLEMTRRGGAIDEDRNWTLLRGV